MRIDVILDRLFTDDRLRRRKQSDIAGQPRFRQLESAANALILIGE